MDRKSLFTGMILGGALMMGGVALGGLAQPEGPAPVIEAPPSDVSLGVVTVRELRIADENGKIGARLYMHPQDVEGYSMFDMYDENGKLHNRIWVNKLNHGYGFFDMVRLEEAQLVNRRNQLMGSLRSAEDHGELNLYNFRQEEVARVGATFRGGGVITVSEGGVPLAYVIASPAGGEINTRLKNGRQLVRMDADAQGGVVNVINRETGAVMDRLPPLKAATPENAPPAGGAGGED